MNSFAVKTEDFEPVLWLKRDISPIDTKPLNATSRPRVRYFMDGVVITTRRHPDVRYISISGSTDMRESLVKHEQQQSVGSNLGPPTRKVARRSVINVKKEEEEVKPIWSNLQVGSSAGLKKQENEDLDIVRLWRNPAIKIERKVEIMKLDPETIRSRIEATGISLIPYHINCDPEVLRTRVSRMFMSTTYGGSSQMTFPNISEEKFERHGFSDFMYPSGDYQPEVPRLPGAPGLWFDIEYGDHDGCVYRLFTRVKKSPAEWLYQGQYRLKRSVSLTREEWAQQKLSVRNAWVRELFRKSWGIQMRVNIYAWNQWDRKPTPEEEADILERQLYKSVLETDIARALTRGDQTFAIYTMECVGCDISFQKDLKAKLATYVPPKRKHRGNPENTEQSTAKGRVSKRRRVKENAESDVESDVVLSDDDRAQKHDSDLELEYTDGEDEL